MRRMSLHLRDRGHHLLLDEFDQQGLLHRLHPLCHLLQLHQDDLDQRRLQRLGIHHHLSQRFSTDRLVSLHHLL